MAEVRIRALENTEADLERFRACFERNGSPRTLAHLRWQYLDNPVGRVFVDVAVPEGEPDRLAAIYATMPAFLRIDGKVVPGVQSLDTLTDTDFRGKGLFVKLANRVFERCTQDGVALVYGFPNGNSAHGFFQRLAWSPLDPVPFIIRPLRANYALRRLPRVGELLSRLPPLPFFPPWMPRLPRGYEVRPIDSFDAAFTHLWEGFAQGTGAAVHRDARYLQWRLKDKPGTRYRVLGLYERGELIAWTAYDVQDKHGGRVGYLLELLHAPGRQRDAARLLQVALKELHESDAEVVLAWCFDHSPNRSAYLRQGFFTLPERVRPIELHAGVRALATQFPVADRSRWYLSYLDSDTV